LIDINWKPSQKELRQFAGIWLVFFGGLGAWWWFSGSTTVAQWLWIAAVGIGVPGLAIPTLVRPIYVLWMALAFPIGWTVSHLLLGIIFYLVITPIGLLVRMLGNDPMTRTLDRNAKSYWVEHRTGADPKSYFKQF
jgi:hypothetical protein